MDAVGDISDALGFLGGGWLSLILAVALGLFIGYLRYAEKKAKRAKAQKDTDLNRAKDQADAAPSNQKAQDEWDKGADEISKIREEAKKKGEGEQ